MGERLATRLLLLKGVLFCPESMLASAANECQNSRAAALSPRTTWSTRAALVNSALNDADDNED